MSEKKFAVKGLFLDFDNKNVYIKWIPRKRNVNKYIQ